MSDPKVVGIREKIPWLCTYFFVRHGCSPNVRPPFSLFHLSVCLRDNTYGVVHKNVSFHVEWPFQHLQSLLSFVYIILFSIKRFTPLVRLTLPTKIHRRTNLIPHGSFDHFVIKTHKENPRRSTLRVKWVIWLIYSVVESGYTPWRSQTTPDLSRSSVTFHLSAKDTWPYR